MFAAVVKWGWVIQCSHHIVGMEKLEAPVVGCSESLMFKLHPPPEMIRW